MVKSYSKSMSWKSKVNKVLSILSILFGFFDLEVEISKRHTPLISTFD